jgi:hypothetical protein
LQDNVDGHVGEVVRRRGVIGIKPDETLIRLLGRVEAGIYETI